MVRSLDGVTVLDLTQVAAGPYCTMLLADAGARVIKIEPPGGEPYRHQGPSLTHADGSTTGSFVIRFGRNKESVTLDLKSAGDREKLDSLVATADVLVHNFRPDTVAGIGLSYSRLAAINERLVYVSISGFGEREFLESPLWAMPAFEIIIEALSGVIEQIGDPTCRAHWSGQSIAVLYAGGMAVNGTLMALLQRERTGLGQHVDVAMLDCMISLNELSIFTYGLTGASTNRSSQSRPSAVFDTADGALVVGISDDNEWQSLCRVMGRPDLAGDTRLATTDDRTRRWNDLVAPSLQRWLHERSTVATATLLNEHGVPAAPIATAQDIFDSPHTHARHMLVDVEYGGYGTHTVVGSPVKLSADPHSTVGSVAMLGEHNADIFGA